MVSLVGMRNIPVAWKVPSLSSVRCKNPQELVQTVNIVVTDDRL
jgi:hypothetical protein